MDEMKVNDGGGLYDSSGLIDSLIVDCNDLPGILMRGQNVKFCSTIVQMVQKLSALKEGIRNEKAEQERKLADLRRMNNDLTEKAFGLPVDRGNEEKQEGD